MTTWIHFLRVIIVEPPLQWLLAILLFGYGMEKRLHWKLWFAISAVLQMAILSGLIWLYYQTGRTDILKGFGFTTPFILLDFLTLVAIGKTNLREVLLRLVGAQALQNTLWSVYILLLIPLERQVVSDISTPIMLVLVLILYALAFLVFRPHLRQKLDYHNLPVLLIAVLALYLKDFLADTPFTAFSDIVINLLAMGIMFDLFQERKLQHQVDIMEQILKTERRQHEMVREEIDIINRKCHDLKHHLLLLHTAGNNGFNEFGTEVEKALDIYDSSIKTGNEVLDVVLMESSCTAKNIR